MLSGVIVNKFIAIYIGPNGLAMIGQFQSFSQIAMITSQAGVNSGVTKYTAAYGAKSVKLPLLFSTAIRISLFCTSVVGIGMILLSKYISSLLFNEEQYSYVFIIFGFSIVFYVLNNLLLAILNGLKEISTYISVNIIQSICTLILTTLLIFLWDIDGVLIALVTNQSAVFLLLIWRLRNHAEIKFKSFLSSFSKIEAKKLSSFSAMAIVSASMIPISHLVIRNYIGETLGWDAAGYWQAIWYISTMYLMVITTALSTYYLPRLAELTNCNELKNELLYGYKILVPVAILFALIIYALKDMIILILFSENFIGMRSLFFWQLIGDVLKVSAWLLSYLLLAKAVTKVFIFLEVVFTLLLMLLSYLFINAYGLEGVTMAYALNYILYFFVLYYLVSKLLNKEYL